MHTHEQLHSNMANMLIYVTVLLQTFLFILNFFLKNKLGNRSQQWELRIREDKKKKLFGLTYNFITKLTLNKGLSLE